MKPTTPYEKMGKKAQRALDARRRGSWGDISPVTRRPENPKAYKRKQARRWECDPSTAPVGFWVG